MRRRGLDDKTIVLTGAMVPYAFGSSDGLFNLGSALSFAQVLPTGVYIAMNGQHFAWDEVRKNRERGVFERSLRDPARVPAAVRSERTIFTVMSRLAADVGAINLSQGFPDFDCDPELVEAVARHMRAGRNQYAPMPGVLALREAIAAMYLASYGRAYDPETEVTITSGATEAIFGAVAACVHPGDEVIVFEPCYDSYVPAIELNGGVPVVVSLRFPDYSVDWDAVPPRDHAEDAAPDRSTRRTIRRGRCYRRRHPRAGRDRGRHRHPRSSATRSTSTSSSTACVTRALRATTRSPRAASSSARSARRITPRAGRSATPWRRQR